MWKVKQVIVILSSKSESTANAEGLFSYEYRWGEEDTSEGV